jgi:metal-dependent amidase/aminoacylase/carboxypeptidase family protein
MAVEDFSWYSLAYPSLFITLGARIEDGVDRPHHNPSFDIDDGVLYRGGALLAATALEIMEAGADPARRMG